MPTHIGQLGILGDASSPEEARRYTKAARELTDKTQIRSRVTQSVTVNEIHDVVATVETTA